MGHSIARAFGSPKDPRDKSGRRHSLPALVNIAICAVICGSEGCADIAEFGQLHLKLKPEAACHARLGG